jgi:hypothetical protein
VKFEILDPRPIEAAKVANEKIFASGPVLGIEVTVPALAARCQLGNIDPQHTGGNKDLAAIEVALTAELPPADAVLATVRADLDSVGAMAVLSMRAEGIIFTTDMDMAVYEIASYDKFARGDWPGQQLLPSRENPWPEKFAHLAPEVLAVEDFKVPLNKRVHGIEKMIALADCSCSSASAEYHKRAKDERMAMIEALENGQIKVDLQDYLVVVESIHKAAINPVGYSFAPVVVALNPEFQPRADVPSVRKFTIAQYQAGYVDLKAVTAELNQLEPGTTTDSKWGGSPTIVGSPQGVSSALTVDQVVAVVEKYLIK